MQVNKTGSRGESPRRKLDLFFLNKLYISELGERRQILGRTAGQDLARRALLQEEIMEADIGRTWKLEPVLTAWIFFTKCFVELGIPDVHYRQRVTLTPLLSAAPCSGARLTCPVLP